MKKKISYKIYDAFPAKKTAVSAAKDLRAAGHRVSIKKGNYGQGLKWGIFEGGMRKKKRR